MKILYVHIGRAKTATTAIQNFLNMNGAALERYGYLYAKTGLYYFNHQPLAWTLFKEAYDQGSGLYWNHAKKYARLDMSPKQYWRTLREEIENTKAQNIIISAEEFGVVRDIDVTTRLFADHVNGLNVKIVVYFRRQDEFLQALYNEAVKGSHTCFSGSFWEYVNPILEVGGADCLRSVEPWAKAVGKENILVRAYEREQLKEGIYADFLNTIGLSLTNEFVIPEPGQNPSLKPWAISVLRRMNGLVKSRSLHRRITRLLTRIATDRRAFHAHGMLTKQERWDLHQMFVESNEIVAKEYMQRPDGKMFCAPPPERP
jgi:hypothetical protein